MEPVLHPCSRHAWQKQVLSTELSDVIVPDRAQEPVAVSWRVSQPRGTLRAVVHFTVNSVSGISTVWDMAHC